MADAAPRHIVARTRRAATLAAAVLLLAAALASASVVVTAVEPGGVADRAGMRAGDVLRSWTRAANPPVAPAEARGTLATPFDWEVLPLEQGRLGVTRVEGEREGQAAFFDLSGPNWGVDVRPELAAEVLALWRNGEALAAAGNRAEAARKWGMAAEQAAASGAGAAAAWLERAAGRLGDDTLVDSILDRATAFAGKDPAIGAAVWQSRGESWERRGDLEAAEEAYREALAARQRACGECLAMARLETDIGFVAQDRGDLDAAETAFRHALELRDKLAAGTPLPAYSLNNLGGVLKAKGQLEAAESAQRRALALLEPLDPDGEDVAQALKLLGSVTYARGDVAEAERCFRRALAIRERLEPDSLQVASSLSNLAVVLQDLGRLDEAESCQRRALALRETLAPDSEDLAASIHNLAALLHTRGNLAETERLYGRALALRERLDPDGVSVAGTLSNLGTVAFDRGRMAEAEEMLSRAVHILEREAPGSADLASALANLGIVARQRGELDAAEAATTKALAIVEALAPASPTVAGFLVNLGNLAWERHRLDDAESLYRRALELHRKLGEESVEVATAWLNLGAVAFSRGQLDEAEARFTRSLAMQRRVAPGSLDVANSLNNLGAVALERRDRKTARTRFEEALAIVARLAPGSALEAELLHELGRIAWKEGRLRRATTLLERAVRALETQMARLGGAEEVKATFRGGFADLYQDLMDVLVERGRPAEAYSVLERSRAQLFLRMLAERDLDLGRDAPPELEAERRRLAEELEAAHAELAATDPVREKTRSRELLAEVRRIGDERAALADRLRAASPRLAALRDPRPLDAHAAAAALEPGSVLLAYALGADSSLLFVVSRDGVLGARRIAAGRAEIGKAVNRFRSMIAAEAAGTVDPGASSAGARELGTLLLLPAEAELARAKRILISPDGPLHTLPFAALLHVEPGGGEQPLAARKPLSVVSSLSVLAELARRRTAPPLAPTLVAFGDPSYPAQGGGDVEVRSVLSRSGALEPLPATRAEVAAIAASFPRGGATTWLGASATEEHALAVPDGTSVVHFACHGLLDPDLPLSSGLALSIPATPSPGRENGLLQAWEVLERLRLDADLVTLSACETGLGREVSGEGLIGLTRAFQYAGARSVLASLWPVADESTALLMEVFYRARLAGHPKDEALREAQMALRARPEFAAPFHWAAFELIGDTR